MSTAKQLLEKIDNKTALIGIIGLGYVGLPLCLALAEAGATVIGFDIDDAKAKTLNSGGSYLKQFSADRVSKIVNKGYFSATSDMSRLREPDVVLICVPTPLSRHLEPDLSFVSNTAHAIAKSARRGQLIILESTTYPGTTAEVLKPIIEQSGLSVGRDIWLAFSPEREDPGNEAFSTTTIPKVVGADDDQSRNLARRVYNIFGGITVPVSTSATAEAVKITENIFRAVNIALVNELKVVFEKMGVDVWQVVDAAKTKPFGFMPFYPGPGLGGHCIPIDPFYLTWKAREFGLSTRFIELAGEINRSMPEYVIGRLTEALSDRFAKALNGATVLVIGLAYKKNIDDMRESPSLELMENLMERGAMVDYFDPYIPTIPETREHASLAGWSSISWFPDKIAEYDAVLISTDHDNIDYKGLCSNAKLVIDTRNVCSRTGANLNVVVTA